MKEIILSLLCVPSERSEKGMEFFMHIIKYFMLFLVLITSSLIGKSIAKKYSNRLKELEEMKTALNIFKSKINYTYSPIPEIFEELSVKIKGNIGNIFKKSREKMEKSTASVAWEEAIEEVPSNLNKDDKYTLKTLSKLLGQTDLEGQKSQIDITQKFLEEQIKEANEQKQKNEKLYSKLGTTIGLAIVIILI